MIVTCQNMTIQHVEACARLFSRNYRAARSKVPCMPECYENHERTMPLLTKLIKRVPGTIVLRHGELVGYLAGQLLHEWRGRRTVYAPFWAHAADHGDQKRIYREMYTHLSSQWIANGCFTHLITTLAHDRATREALFWMGFGMVVVDTMRDMTRPDIPSVDVTVWQANANDLDTIVALDNKLAMYLSSPSMFLPLIEKRKKPYHEEWLAKPSHALWLASHSGETVAFLKMCRLDVNYLVTDEKTIWIQGAYTTEHARGKGIGTKLLDHALAWAQEQGYERCAVDFESDNALACAFWLQHFQPVCFSLSRHVDPRIVWAHADREDKYFWS